MEQEVTAGVSMQGAVKDKVHRGKWRIGVCFHMRIGRHRKLITHKNTSTQRCGLSHVSQQFKKPYHKNIMLMEPRIS